MSLASRSCALLTAALSATALALALSLVWCNMERVSLAYQMRKVQAELDAQRILAQKLDLERASLLSPNRMQDQAREYGLSPATAGRIRKLAAEARP